MDKNEMLKLLNDVADSSLTPEQALMRIKTEPFDELGFAMPDHHRGVRQGVGEVIYGAGKTPQQIADIANDLLENGQSRVLVTRMSREAYEYAKDRITGGLEYHEAAKLGIVGGMPEERTESVILVITAGTSDIPVAEEAALTAEFLGNRVKRVYDAGVAGILSAKVIIAIAGMEGALASVVGGLADHPVIAVPTSVGYGASFGGVSALLSMLNSCASGVSVVNIDNGFGAAYMANMINKL